MKLAWLGLGWVWLNKYDIYTLAISRFLVNLYCLIRQHIIIILSIATQLRTHPKTMIEQMSQQSQVPAQSEQLIHIIEQFLECLNYPHTKLTLAKQKNSKRNRQNGSVCVDGVQQVCSGKVQEVKQNQCVQSVVNKDFVQEKGQGSFNEMQEKVKEQIGNQIEMINQKQQTISKQKKQEHTESHYEKNIKKPKQQQQPSNHKQKQKQTLTTSQFRWKPEQAKFYSKFASFSEIVYCLQTSNIAQHELTDCRLNTNEMHESNNEVLEDAKTSKPTLLHLFSAFDTISKVREYTVPIYRNLSLQPKFSKPTKFMQANPKQNYLCVVDQASNLVLVNLQERCILQFMKPDQSEQITAIKWLKSGLTLAVGSSSGKLTLYSFPHNRSFERLNTFNPHLSQITSIFCTREYIYTCSTDFTISRVLIRTMKLDHNTKLRNSCLKSIAKIEHKKLKDNIIFGVDREGKQVLMIDENTGLQTVLFDVGRDHVKGPMCQKGLTKRDDRIGYSTAVRLCNIADMLVNNDNNTLIISVSGLNPSIYELDPLRNQCILRLNHRVLKCPFMPQQTQQTQTATMNGTSVSNIFNNLQPNSKSATTFGTTHSLSMSLSHRSQLLCVTTNSNRIFYVRLKNWRILYEHTETGKNFAFGFVAVTRNFSDFEDKGYSMIHNDITGYYEGGKTSLLSAALGRIDRQHKTMDMTQRQPQSNNKNGHNNNRQKQQKQCIVCVHNQINNNIEIYYNTKQDLKTIRSDNVRARPFLSSALGFPSSAQGFLQLLQTIRENYQNFA